MRTTLMTSWITETLPLVTRRPPLLPAGQLESLLSGATPLADRARRELGWHRVPLADGLRTTVRRLVERGALARPG